MCYRMSWSVKGAWWLLREMQMKLVFAGGLSIMNINQMLTKLLTITR